MVEIKMKESFYIALHVALKRRYLILKIRCACQDFSDLLQKKKRKNVKAFPKNKSIVTSLYT